LLQIAPYLLLFWGKYREFIFKRYRPCYGFLFVLPLLLPSFDTFIKLTIYCGIITGLDLLGLWRLNFLAFWLPVEFNLIPANVSKGEFAGYFTAVSLLAHYLARYRDIDFSIKSRYREVLKVYVILALLLVPAGLITGFIKFNPVIERAISLPGIFFAVGYPEELLFRAFLFRVLKGYLNNSIILLISSLIFGLSHFNGPHGGVLYVVFATVAGLGYGHVYLKTGSVASAAFLHTLVDFTWTVLFGG